MSDTGEQIGRHNFVDRIVGVFVRSNLSLILMALAAALGVAALSLTPREEDPQIVVPLADIHVRAPGYSAGQVERLVVTPLEKLLYQIDGVEHVYSMAHADSAVITVRFYVGQDRERSLVKLYKRIDEHIDIVPSGVEGWVVKPVEIDDVPIVTLALTSATADEFTLRRTAEEVVERLASVRNTSRALLVGGRPRTAHVYLDPDRMQAYSVAPLGIRRAIMASGVTLTSGDFSRMDQAVQVQTGPPLRDAGELRDLVVAVADGRPVFLKDVASVVDGPAEATSYVRHGWGPGRGFESHAGMAGALVGAAQRTNGGDGRLSNGWDGRLPNGWDGRLARPQTRSDGRDAHPTRFEPDGRDARPTPQPPDHVSQPAVTIAIAKQKGSNAVWVARDVLRAAEALKRDVIPDDMELVVTRNAGLTADEKVNELIEALGVAILIVMALLTLTLGWREALIVCVAVPVVFGLTLAVNLLLGYTINRVTLFALILSLGLLVDDPIVDVENIVRHFRQRKKATLQIVLEAVSEIRPPLITATLAVIVSFLPMFFITGMMGPYMRPMALNVPVAMLMSMVVAFTITPWLSYHVLKRRYGNWGTGLRPVSEPSSTEERPIGDRSPSLPRAEATDEHDIDPEALKSTPLYRFFHPLMAPLLRARRSAWFFMGVMLVLTLAAAGLAAVRAVPLKMLPFDNKNELQLVLEFDEGVTLERADAAVRAFERHLAGISEVTDFTSYVGTASPMDFNGLVRHYYLRSGPTVADIRIDLVGKKNRRLQSHAIGLRERDGWTKLAAEHGARLSVVETPPGPPVIATLVAEVYGRDDHRYDDLLAAATTVRERMRREPGVVDVDDVRVADASNLIFEVDREKAALSGVSAEDVSRTLQIALAGGEAGELHDEHDRNPLRIVLHLPRDARSSRDDLGRLVVKGENGQLVPLAEIGAWRESRVDQTIYHKDLRRVAYVFAEVAGRPPAEAVLDIQADCGSGDMLPKQRLTPVGAGAVGLGSPRPLSSRTYLSSGGHVRWHVFDQFEVEFAGEGEWQITLDVFRDLGLAFAAALGGIYILLVAQTGSFALPLVVMLAIPLTVLGIMPGFWLLSLLSGGNVGGYADPVFFTATGMIGMIALAGIVTRDAIILVDFIHLSQARGRSLFDAIMESRVVRLRPILLTSATAMLSALPITIDPIFSGLAWALIFGLLASTVFTLFVIPVSYWLLYERTRRAGRHQLSG
ncbi:Efflux pump membrane transporter BepG [Phycisphaerae bacterium RAS1]|nr:Efflux pump membrane transporter BepG [Phycisphaerae bacterium RAS1]